MPNPNAWLLVGTHHPFSAPTPPPSRPLLPRPPAPPYAPPGRRPPEPTQVLLLRVRVRLGLANPNPNPNPNPNQVERTSGWLRQKVLSADIEWVRELLRFGTGRATLRAFDEPANSYEDDKDHVKVQIYRDLKKEVDLHKDIPTASTCARTIFLPVFAKEEHFLQKLDTALQEFRVQQNQRGGAEFSYE